MHRRCAATARELLTRVIFPVHSRYRLRFICIHTVDNTTTQQSQTPSTTPRPASGPTATTNLEAVLITTHRAQSVCILRTTILILQPTCGKLLINFAPLPHSPAQQPRHELLSKGEPALVVLTGQGTERRPDRPTYLNGGSTVIRQQQPGGRLIDDGATQRARWSVPLLFPRQQ